MEKTNIVSVKYEDRYMPKTFSGKAYSYITAIPLEVGDLVVAPTSYGDDNSNSTLMYIVTNLIVISVVVKFMMTQNEFISTKFKIFLSLIVAGGASNVIDRILRGYVKIDFSIG